MANKVLTITVPNDPIEVITIRVPGQQGPGGLPGPAGPSSVLSIGTVSSLAEGAQATASLSGVSPTQTLNLGIPRGATGAPGAPSNLTIGTITTSAPGGNGAATITGTAPNYTLNLTLPRGYGVPSLGVASQVLVKNSSTDYDTSWLTYTDAATASTIVYRNSSGNFSANLIAGSAAPTVASHLTRKDYVDAIGATTETPSTIVRRDASGDIYVTDAYASAAPTVASQLTRKDYVDTQVATRAASTHTHTASQISDSTTTGRSVLTATDGPAARTAIGAGTSSLVLGTTSSTAKAGDYQPTAANISDSTAVGRSVITATDNAAARTAIGAGTSNLVIGTTSTTAKAGDYVPATATESVSGISRFATAAETQAGSLTTVSVHPAGLKSAIEKKENVDLITDIKYPLWIGHRGGGALVFPEESMEGYRESAQHGFAVECDVHVLSDNTLVLNHDTTLNRTTTGSGNVSATTYATWESLQIKPIYPGRDYCRTVTWKRLADELGGQALLMPEVKVSTALTPLLDDIERRGIKRGVIVQSFTYSDCQAAAARGIPALFLSDSATPSTLVSDGIQFLGCTTSVSDTYINNAKAAGLKVFVYTTQSVTVANAQIARGVDGVFSDDPWLHSNKFPRQRVSPVQKNGEIVPALGPVQLANATAHDASSNPYRQTANGLWMDLATSTVADGVTHSIRQTWAGTLPATFTLRFRVTFDSKSTTDQSRWCGVYWGTLADDAGFRDAAIATQNGYHILTARSGGGGAYRVTSSGAALISTASTSGTTTEIAPTGKGGSALIEIQFTSTQIIYTNLTLGFSQTYTDSGFRGTNGVLALTYRDVSVEISELQIIE